MGKKNIQTTTKCCLPSVQLGFDQTLLLFGSVWWKAYERCLKQVDIVKWQPFIWGRKAYRCSDIKLHQDRRRMCSVPGNAVSNKKVWRSVVKMSSRKL